MSFFFKLKNLKVAITFFYKEERLFNLSKVLSQIPNMAHKYKVYIFTNTDLRDQKKKLENTIYKTKNLNFEIIIEKELLNPHFLAGCHIGIFKTLFQNDADITHFLYLEDDILVLPKNISYWVESRKILKSKKLIPSFLRYELKKFNIYEWQSFFNKKLRMFSVDVTEKIKFDLLPKVFKTKKYCFVNIPQPYQGMYFLDRELMEEFLDNKSWTFGNWGIREKYAQGVTFTNIPKGYTSRNVLGYNIEKKIIDTNSMICHLTNNYINDLNSPFAKISISDLIVF
jgi:hypothetical protein